MNDIKRYLDTVCEQIRFQKAHDFVKKELQDHISDQINAFIEQGITEKEAIQKAIQEMGDPILVGTELDRIHRPKLKWSIIVFIFLLSLGHFAIQYIFFKDIFYTAPLFQNITIFLIYVGIMILFYHIDFTILASHCKLFYVIYTVLLLFCYYCTQLSGYFLAMDLSEMHMSVIGAFTDIYYILFNTIRLPVFIYFFPVILVGLLYYCREKSYKALLLCCCSILPTIFFCYDGFLKMPCIVISIVSFILIISSVYKNWFTVKKKYAITLVCSITILAIVLMYCINYLSGNNFINSVRYDYMKYIQTILQNNIKNSCFIGKGKEIYITQYYNHSIINGFDFLKEWTEYFIASALHSFGWIALLPILIFYFFFIKGFLLIKKQKNQLGFMTAKAIFLMFFIISTWNIISNTGIFVVENPLGIPFFSTSDSVNIIFFALIGILLSVFRTGEMTTDKYIKNSKKNKHFIFVSDNKINISIPIPFIRKNTN